MTVLEKPRVLEVPEVPVGRRLGWTPWVVLVLMILAGVMAAILLSVDGEGALAEEVGAELAYDNYVTAHRVSALEQAAGNDLALEFTSLRVMEEVFPGRLEMRDISAGRADQVLRYTIDRLVGG